MSRCPIFRVATSGGRVSVCTGRFSVNFADSSRGPTDDEDRASVRDEILASRSGPTEAEPTLVTKMDLGTGTLLGACVPPASTGPVSSDRETASLSVRLDPGTALLPSVEVSEPGIVGFMGYPPREQSPKRDRRTRPRVQPLSHLEEDREIPERYLCPTPADTHETLGQRRWRHRQDPQRSFDALPRSSTTSRVG